MGSRGRSGDGDATGAAPDGGVGGTTQWLGAGKRGRAPTPQSPSPAAHVPDSPSPTKRQRTAAGAMPTTPTDAIDGKGTPDSPGVTLQGASITARLAATSSDLQFGCGCMARAPTDCLKQFTTPEQLAMAEWVWCSQCQAVTRTTRQLLVRRLPPVLCLHLKRFNWASRTGYA